MEGSKSAQIITGTYLDPGGPKTYGSYGSGSGTLLESVQIERQDKKEESGRLGNGQREDLGRISERAQIKRGQRGD